MSNNLEYNKNSYDIISNINELNFQNKSILIIGSGEMAKQYALALYEMKIKNVSVLSRNKDSVKQLCSEFNYIPIYGDLNEELSKIPEKDLTIIATSVDSLYSITKSVIQNNQKNILIEKPGSLYSDELLDLNQNLKNSRVRIAYNRLTYPNFHKLKSIISKEGISSCNFNFTEIIHYINFEKNIQNVYSRWGVANSLHIISMVFELIGFPKDYKFYNSGSLAWHPTGSVFVGSGKSENEILFSYHADWNSAGRWGIEIMTKNNAYRLISLEELFVRYKNTFEWKKVSFNVAYPGIKQGIAEQISVMLEKSLEQKIPLVTLEKGVKLISIAEEMLGYNKPNKDHIKK
jgi:predicted dehydrogenase